MTTSSLTHSAPSTLSAPTPTPTLLPRLATNVGPSRIGGLSRVVGLASTVGLALIVGLALATPSSAAAQDGLAVGATPELVVLETLDGDSVDLGDITGTKPVLLEFWATWCAVCRALEPEMRAAHAAFGDQVEFVAVAAAVAQTKERVKQHLARHPAPGRVLWDTRGRFTRAFDAPGTGYVVVLGADGTVVYAGTGPDQDLVGALRAALGLSSSP